MTRCNNNNKSESKCFQTELGLNTVRLQSWLINSDPEHLEHIHVAESAGCHS